MSTVNSLSDLDDMLPRCYDTLYQQGQKTLPWKELSFAEQVAFAREVTAACAPTTTLLTEDLGLA